MKKLSLFFLSLLVTICAFAQVKVRGYYRANGTYVQPHMRSSPDKDPTNNYSYPGNTNPYTGKVATGNPETYLKNYSGSNTTSPSSTGYSSTSTYPSTTLPSTYSSSSTGSQTFSTQPTTRYNSGYISDEVKSVPTYPNNSTNFNTPTDNTFRDSERKAASHFNNIINAEKKYLKDAKGNYTGEYLKLVDEDETTTQYTLYNANDFPQGKLIVYANGQRILFDNFGKIVARSKKIHSKR